ncbi:hypothetical protein OVY29_21940 [Sphingopyxis sp. SE2]|uniref:hypothetical protein n=1 Tax=Sphingopyxis sp. SE2 TaxID=1586240 RepID=UPI0028C0A6EB|nr:hypothetical protein [Sphingopyxis sp. SE2]MDT7531323.1 hypothetical protein [Sphingopyxis sp. SE2]
MDPIALPGVDAQELAGYIAALVAILATIGAAAFTLKIGEKSIVVVKRILNKF